MTIAKIVTWANVLFIVRKLSKASWKLEVKKKCKETYLLGEVDAGGDNDEQGRLETQEK